MKIAVYCRVSKSEEGAQNPDNQLIPLRKMAESLNFQIVNEYIDRVSGATSERPQFQQMLEDAYSHKFDMILIWSLDRFSREGILQTLDYIKRLNQNHVSLKSLQESWLDTRDESLGSLLIAIFSWVAEQERKRISDRTKAGLKGKKNVGKRGKDKRPRRKSGYWNRWNKKK